MQFWKAFIILLTDNNSNWQASLFAICSGHCEIGPPLQQSQHGVVCRPSTEGIAVHRSNGVTYNQMRGYKNSEKHIYHKNNIVITIFTV